MQSKLILILALALVVAQSSQAEPTAAEILAKLPATTLTDEITFSTQLVKLGPAGLKDVAKLIVPLGTGDDTKARYALAGITRYIMRDGGETDRAAYVGILLDSLAANKDVEVKTFFLHELQQCGKDDAVAAIAPLLADVHLCEPASQALQGIGTPAAAMALAAALPGATDATRITLTKACGVMRVTSAADEVMKSASAADASLRLTALYSLANIPVTTAGDVLKKATEATAPLEKAKATSFYLLFARRLAETGNKDRAAQICRDVVRTRLAPEEANVRSAALSSLVIAIGEAALPDLLVAAGSNEIELRVAALNLGQSLRGESVTARWAQLMTESPSAEVRTDVLRMLAGRGDKAATAAVLGMLNDREETVRLAAIPAAAKLAGDDAVGPLIDLITSGDVNLVKAASEVLARLPGDRALAAAADAMSATKTPPAKIALLELLGARAAQKQAPAIFEMLKSPDHDVRIAALHTLATAGGPEEQTKLLAMATAKSNGAERASILRAVVSIAQGIADPEQRAGALLTALANLKGNDRAALLTVLPRVPGQASLDAVVTDSTSADPVVMDAAIRALAEWPDSSAVNPLLKTAVLAIDETHQIIALRAAIDLAKKIPGPSTDRVQVYTVALGASKRVEEKKLVLAALSGEHSEAALNAASPSLDDAALRSTAAVTVARIILPSKDAGTGLRGATAATVLQKAAPLIADPRLREQAEGYLKTIKR